MFVTGLLPECLKQTLVPKSEEHVRVGHIWGGAYKVLLVVVLDELVVFVLLEELEEEGLEAFEELDDVVEAAAELEDEADLASKLSRTKSVEIRMERSSLEYYFIFKLNDYKFK
jgi:hypothetical protein